MVFCGINRANSAAPDRQKFMEQEHFLGCLAYVYDPALWISYDNALYFMPKNDEQTSKLQEMITARAKYRELANRQTRHQLAANALAGSGLDEAWQNKILLPYSLTNENLTPTLNRQLRIVPSFKFLRAFDEDAFIQADDSIYFVIGFGRGGTNSSGTNAFLIKEGWKSFTTTSGEKKRVEAFTDVALTPEERSVLNTAVAGFHKAAAVLAEQFTNSAARRQEFESLRARASDASPYFQYLVAKGYLEGRGTEKDEDLGMEWMRRAARNGSGDALSYLDQNKPKTP